jgi:hypothetical protein
MLDKVLLAQKTANYTEEQLHAIAKGFCPKCLSKNETYRILKTYFDEEQKMQMYHVKCDNLVECEWDERVPAVRIDNGLEGFFES